MARNTHPEQTERRILASAQKLFTQKGFEKTSIQDILNDLGDLSKGAIYHHFKSKEAILDRLNADEWAVTTHLLDELLSRRDVTALEKLRILMLSALEDPSHLDLVRFQLSLVRDPAVFSANMRFWSTELPGSFRALIDQGISDGSIPTEYPQQAAQLLALLCNYWLMPCFYPATHKDMENRIRCLSRMLDAIGVPLFDEPLIVRAIKQLMELVPEGEGLGD